MSWSRVKKAYEASLLRAGLPLAVGLRLGAGFLLPFLRRRAGPLDAEVLVFMLRDM